MSARDLPALTGPSLSLAERDRRWAGLRRLMAERGIDALVVGSFQGRERLESYLVDDFIDGVVVLGPEGAPTVVGFATGRISRSFESARRGWPLWTEDYRVGSGAAGVADVLGERGWSQACIGIVGLGPTAPGEADGLLPLGFWRGLNERCPGARFVDFTRDLTDFMLVKSPEELQLLRHAAQVSERACQVMAEACRPGVSEAEVHAEVMREVYRNGCELRYPFLSLQSGPDNIGWGVPRWTFRAERPRILERGDLVQAEIHTTYGGQEAQVQMCVALEPVHPDVRRCETVARAAYAQGLAAVRPGATFADVVRAMEEPMARAGCWSKTPLLHTLTFGATGFTAVNRQQLEGSRDHRVEAGQRPGVRRGDLVLQEGMGLELEPNACLGMVRVNIGAGVVVGAAGAIELNELPTRVFYRD